MPYEYDRQVIVRVLTGNAAEDQIIIDGAENLQKKAHGTHKPALFRATHRVVPTEIVDYPKSGADRTAKMAALKQAFANLTAGVTSDLYARVYNVGVLSKGTDTGRKQTGRKKRKCVDLQT